MHFRFHKVILVLLIFIEALLGMFPQTEEKLYLHIAMGGVYFVVTMWFVFGPRRWWLYQFAGVGYVAYVIINRILFVFQSPLNRSDYHLILAGFWVLILLAHLFVEREIGPPMSRPPGRKDERLYPDGEDDDGTR